MEIQTGLPDEEGMCTLRLEFFKDLCKHQAAQICDLNAQVTTQQERIAHLEAYISKLEAKTASILMSISCICWRQACYLQTGPKEPLPGSRSCREHDLDTLSE